MQTHMWNNGVNIDIPIVRVMNTAHFLAAYMFATTCSGDQTEYDAMADMSLGRDKQMFRVTMIVLAAMLARTEGFRARQCRNLILDNRDPDFDEGVTLYDRFLRSAEKRFAEEDFLIDTHTQIQKLVAENEQLRYEKNQLEIKYRIMENQQNIQYKQDNNQGTIYNAPVYITYTTPIPQPELAEDIEPDAPTDVWGKPKEGKYSEVRRYIEERKKGDPEFKQFCHDHSLRDLCTRLTREFGWFVDEHSLGANLNRHV